MAFIINLYISQPPGYTRRGTLFTSNVGGALMAIPGQSVNAHPRMQDTHSLTDGSSHSVAISDAPALPSADPLFLATTEKTRTALLKLGDSPRDTLALSALWDENRSSIEHELHIHLYSDSNSPLLQQLLARLVWHARFFCDEVDDPKAWVTRCANLEARRLALQLTEAR
jgi:hypothetical protein